MKQKNFFATIKTASLGGALLLVGGFNMGTTSCGSPTPTTPSRVLKMNTEVGTITAQKVTLPSGETVDFPYVANALFYAEVIKSNYMAVSVPLPVITPPAAVAMTAVKTDEADPRVQTLRAFGLVSAEFTSGAHQMNASAPPADACVYTTPEFSIGGQVTNFSAQAGGGLSIGFGSTPGKMGSVGVQYTQAELDMQLILNRPLTDLPLEVGQAQTYQQSINADLAYGMIGLNFFFDTPITTAIQKAMDGALSNIINKYITDRNPDWNQDWQTKVVYCQNCDNDTHVAIAGGAQNGIKVGDTMTIWNMNYQWKAIPCQSEMVMSTPDNPTIPTAYGTVQYVDDNFSVLGITKYTGNPVIRLGANVQLEAFVAPATPTPTATPAKKSTAN